MRVTHIELVRLANAYASKLEYKSKVPIKGLCHGSAALALDAILTSADRINKFNKTLTEIQEFLDHTQQIFSSGHPPAPEDGIKLHMLQKFLRKIMLHQYPQEYINLQNPDNVTYIQDIDKTMSSFQSKKLITVGGLHKAAVFSGFYDLSNDSLDIELYITALKEAVHESFLDGISFPFVLLFCNGTHAFELGYRSGAWYVFDINQCKKDAILRVSFDDTDSLKIFLKAAILSRGEIQNDKSHYAISSALYCSKNNEKKAAKLRELFLSNLDKCKLTHITAEKIEKGAMGNSWLVMAARSGDIDSIKSLIQAGVNQNLQDNNGTSALIIAARNGHADIVNLLIQAGINQNLQDNDGTSALIIAAQTGRIAITHLLIEKGADASKLHYNTDIFEQKFSALMCKNSLTLDDKKCLIKLYIILRTAEEMDRIKYIKRSIPAFFQPEYVYTEKIKAAEDLLKALEEKQDFSEDSPVLQDGRLKKIYELCFDSEIPRSPILKAA